MDNREWYCDTPEEAAQMSLLALMSGISELCWCAGWMMGNENACWRAAESGDAMEYGQQEITRRQSQLLKLLSDECGGWWRWGDTREEFIRLDKWRETYSKTPGTLVDG